MVCARAIVLQAVVNLLLPGDEGTHAVGPAQEFADIFLKEDRVALEVTVVVIIRGDPGLGIHGQGLAIQFDIEDNRVNVVLDELGAGCQPAVEDDDLAIAGDGLGGLVIGGADIGDPDDLKGGDCLIAGLDEAGGIGEDDGEDQEEGGEDSFFGHVNFHGQRGFAHVHQLSGFLYIPILL